MAVEFNPDGSIKLPGKIRQFKDDQEKDFQDGRVIRMVRRAISDRPLIDELQILLSPKIEDPHRVDALFRQATNLFRHMAQLRISKYGEREYVVRIVSGQFRDTWISEFRYYLRDQMKTQIQYWGSANDFRKGYR